MGRQTPTMMTVAIRNQFVAISTLAFTAILLSACSNSGRSGGQSDCAKARARYSDMRRSVRDLYAVGTTSSAQIAIAERRLDRAKRNYESVCGGRNSSRSN